jgi:type I restriction-modification system specificity subunit
MKSYSNYKDSGVKWLGQIPQHWEVRTLSQLSKEHYISNKEVHHQNLLSLSYGRIVQKNINTTSGLLPASYDTYQIIEDGNIVLRLTDLQNDQKSLRVGLCTQEGIITSAYLAIAPREYVIPHYLYLALHTMDLFKMFYSMGNGIRQNLSWKELRKSSLPLPPLSEQLSIVSYLDGKVSAMDRLVLLTQQKVEHLKALKQAIIQEAVTMGIPNKNHILKQTNIKWIKQIPQHWEEKKIRSLFSERKEKVSDKEWEALSVSKQGITPQLESAVKTDNGDNRKKVCCGDFVVNSRSDRKGSCGFSDYDGSVSLISIVLKPRNIIGKYYHYLLRSNDYIEEFYRNGRGIVADLWTTRYSEMKNIELPFPPLSEQEEIVAYLDEKTAKIDLLIDKELQQIDHIKDLKQTLIADVVTGKVDVTTKH